MNYLVGLTADRGGRDALALGRMLARTGNVTLAEYAAFLASHAEDTTVVRSSDPEW
jgi:hypothetical protein